MESKRVTRTSFFTWRHPPFSLEKVRKQAAVLRIMFHAFLYALSQITVSILKSASGHRIRGAEKENSDGKHIDMTFNAWSFIWFYAGTSIAPSMTCAFVSRSPATCSDVCL